MPKKSSKVARTVTLQMAKKYYTTELTKSKKQDYVNHLESLWYAAAIRSNKVRTADADWTTNRAAERFPTSFEGRGTSLDAIQDTASKCQRINIPFTHTGPLISPQTVPTMSVRA